MSDQSPYDALGITESASFEEIQEVRNRLVQEYEGDRKHVETIEAAYDAILMERLRMRQEGKIKVPDRIRFPEKLVPTPSNVPPAPAAQGPTWLQRLIDTPGRGDVLWPAGLFLGLSVLAVYFPPLALALGVGTSLYFLNRKERKFGRAVLLTVIGATVGIVVGSQLYGLLQPLLGGLSFVVDPANTVAAWITFVVLWLVTSFLK